MPADGPPMLRESTSTSMGRTISRFRVSKMTPTIGAPSISGWGTNVMSAENRSPSRSPSSVIVSPTE